MLPELSSDRPGVLAGLKTSLNRGRLLQASRGDDTPTPDGLGTSLQSSTRKGLRASAMTCSSEGW